MDEVDHDRDLDVVGFGLGGEGVDLVTVAVHQATQVRHVGVDDWECTQERP